MKPIGIITLAVALAVPTAAHAEPDIWDTKASFSANRSMTVKGGPSINGAYYHTPTLERWDMRNQGNETRVVTRKDQEKAYMILPAKKMYMEISVKGTAMGGRRPTGDVTVTRIGEDKINGEDTVKYKVTTKGKKGEFEGHIWVAAGNIHMKMDGTAKSPGRQQHFTMILTDLKRGDQDPKLFEVPTGYRKIGK